MVFSTVPGLPRGTYLHLPNHLHACDCMASREWRFGSSSSRAGAVQHPPAIEIGAKTLKGDHPSRSHRICDPGNYSCSDITAIFPRHESDEAIARLDDCDQFHSGRHFNTYTTALLVGSRKDF